MKEATLAKCRTCGAEVPQHEWPADRTWPILCGSCLGNPKPTREQTPEQHEPASTEPTADFD